MGGYPAAKDELRTATLFGLIAMDRDLSFGLIILLCAIWAGNYFVVKDALVVVDPISFAFLRAIFGGILIFALGGHALGGLRRSDYLWLALLGFFNISLFLILLNVALTTVDPGVVSTLVYTQPVFVAALSPLVGERLSGKKALGIVAAFSGVAIVFGSSLSNFTPVLGDAYALLAALSWALATVLFKRSKRRYTAQVATSVQLLAGSLFIIPALVIAGPRFSLGLPLVLYLGYNVVLATGFGYVLYFRILARMPATQFASYFFLVPVLTQLMGSILFLSLPSWNVVLGTLLVAMGIVAVNR